jgi:hypothetical protein
MPVKIFLMITEYSESDIHNLQAFGKPYTRLMWVTDLSILAGNWGHNLIWARQRRSVKTIKDFDKMVRLNRLCVIQL